jgi:hypothetical protein
VAIWDGLKEHADEGVILALGTPYSGHGPEKSCHEGIMVFGTRHIITYSVASQMLYVTQMMDDDKESAEGDLSVVRGNVRREPAIGKTDTLKRV